MAIIKNPTASLYELGILSETLDVYVWKGLTVVRKHSHAFDPRNPAQLVQRARMTDGVHWWKYNGHPVDVRDSWNRLAQYKTLHLPGYHVGLGNIMKAAGQYPNPRIVTHALHWHPWLIVIHLRNLDLDTFDPEPGPFLVAYGNAPQSLTTIVSLHPGTGGSLQLYPPPGWTPPIYLHVYKKHSRSGIVKTTQPI